jgi:hypothetical protein
MPRDLSIDGLVYRTAIRLYPPRFRQAFASELVRDFREARTEVLERRDRRGLWAFRAGMLADFVCSLPREWWRSGWPAFVILAVLGTTGPAFALLRFWPRQIVFVPPDGLDRDVVTVQLLVVSLLFVIAATLIITVWSTRPRRTLRRRPPC